MSEETPPAKKATRKSVRKKSATKRAPRKSSPSENPDEQLPLDEAPESAESASKQPKNEGDERAEGPAKKRGREPKSGVRDARRETSDESSVNEANRADEISEKLVDSDSPAKDEKPQKSGEQNRSEQNDGRGRGRNRGRGRGSERSEKREPKPRVPVDPKDMAKKAWKIFESEVTEEGLALLDDNGLRDYARSSFNAARIFLEEEGRVTGRQEKPKKEKKTKAQDDD